MIPLVVGYDENYIGLLGIIAHELQSQTYGEQDPEHGHSILEQGIKDSYTPDK